MIKKEVLELTRRFKKDGCTFTRMGGCYVNANKEKVVHINETFLNLADVEFFKYLEIAKKTLSGTIGNNLLELNFSTAEESIGGKQHFLMALKESKLKNEALLDRLYDLIIDTYEYVGNYLILIYHDAYDVITKTSDNGKLDESEEVYEYLLCAICPVKLSKPGLGYREVENRIGARERDWIVDAPVNGFLFPAFTDRSSDIHSLMYYTKDPANTNHTFIETGLGCGSKRSFTEQRETLHTIIKKEINDSDEKTDEILLKVQQHINEKKEIGTKEEPLIITEDTVQEIMTESGLPEDVAAKISKSYAEEFNEELPAAENLVDPKILKNVEKKKIEDEEAAVKTYDVLLRVKPEKAAQIHSQIINGQKCLVIPMSDNEHAAVNGVKTQV